MLKTVLEHSNMEDIDPADDGKMLFTLEDVTAAKGLAQFIRAILFLERVTEAEFKNALGSYNTKDKLLTLSNAKRALFNPNITIRTIVTCFSKILKWKVVVLFRVTNTQGVTTTYDPVETLDKVYHVEFNTKK
jgi:hypothetical protein